MPQPSVGGGETGGSHFSLHVEKSEKFPLVLFLSVTGRGERNLSLLPKEEDEGVSGFILLLEENNQRFLLPLLREEEE